MTTEPTSTSPAPDPARPPRTSSPRRSSPPRPRLCSRHCAPPTASPAGGAPATGSPDRGWHLRGRVRQRHVGSSSAAAAVEQRRVEWTVEARPAHAGVGRDDDRLRHHAGDGATELHFRHHGLTPQLECFDMCHEGWTHYVASLVAYVEPARASPTARTTGGTAARTASPGAVTTGARRRARRPQDPMRSCGRSPTRTGARSSASSSDDELPAGQIATQLRADPTGGQPAPHGAQAGRPRRRAPRGHPRLYRFRPRSLEPVRELLDEFWPDALEPAEAGGRTRPPERRSED